MPWSHFWYLREKASHLLSLHNTNISVPPAVTRTDPESNSPRLDTNQAFNTWITTTRQKRTICDDTRPSRRIHWAYWFIPISFVPLQQFHQICNKIFYLRNNPSEEYPVIPYELRLSTSRSTCLYIRLTSSSREKSELMPYSRQSHIFCMSTSLCTLKITFFHRSWNYEHNTTMRKLRYTSEEKPV